MEGDARGGMQMARDLVRDGAGRRLMPEGEPADRDLAENRAAEAHVDHGVVVAGQPEPFAILLQDGERPAVDGAHAVGRAAIMEAVAKAEHGRGRIRIEGCGEALERRRRVVGGQHEPACGEGGALLQMQVGDDQDVLGRPVERTRDIGHERAARDRDRLPAELTDVETLGLELQHLRRASHVRPSPQSLPRSAPRPLRAADPRA